MSVQISFGVPEGQKAAVARLFYEAFEPEFRLVFGPRDRGIPIISKHLRDDRTVVAVSGGVVVGFAGLKFNEKGFIDVSFWQLIRELGSDVLRVLFVGCCFLVLRQVWMFLNRPREREIFLDALAVTRNMRGKRIGRGLLNFIVDFGRTEGHRQIRLFVVDMNAKAKRLFERSGFRETRCRRIVFPWNKIIGIKAVSEMICGIQIASRRSVE